MTRRLRDEVFFSNLSLSSFLFGPRESRLLGFSFFSDIFDGDTVYSSAVKHSKTHGSLVELRLERVELKLLY